MADEIKSNIHLYVILDLAIKSVQHDQKLFESFKVYRPYINLCNRQLKVLNDEFKQVQRALYKRYVSFVSYRCMSHSECSYDFRYRKELISFLYKGEDLKEQVDRKIKLVLQALGEEQQHESNQNANDIFIGGTKTI